MYPKLVFLRGIPRCNWKHQVMFIITFPCPQGFKTTMKYPILYQERTCIILPGRCVYQVSCSMQYAVCSMQYVDISSQVAGPSKGHEIGISRVASVPWPSSRSSHDHGEYPVSWGISAAEHLTWASDDLIILPTEGYNRSLIVVKRFVEI